MKKQYIKPTVKSVEFQVEMGFAMSARGGMTANGLSLFEEFNFDNNDRGRFTRPTDNPNIWSDDGSNGGYWD